MSAFRTWRIRCDGRDKVDGALVLCMRRYQPPADAKSRQIANPSGLRRLAAKDGWTHVRGTIRRLDDDYCPDHKPAEDGA